MRSLAVFALLALAGAAHAQPAELGKPVPDAELAAGSVSVRVVLAAMDRPATTLAVSLVSSATGKERVVRTDAQGRALFAGLEAGATYTAFTKIGETEIASEAFTVPASGGLRILMSPAPIRSPSGTAQPGAQMPAGHGGPMAGGMPDPRQMSGMARPEQKDPAGTLTIRVIQGKFRQDPIAGRVADFPKDAVVVLVGYGRGGAVTVQSKKVDDGGRARFSKLATDNSVSYYAMAVLERANGARDRLMSGSIELLPQVGMRVMLAGHAPDSDEPPIDDLPAVRQRPSLSMPGPGQVRIDLAGRAEAVEKIEIAEVNAPDVVVATSPVSDASSGVQDVSGSAGQPAANAGLRDGLIQVAVTGPGNAAIAGSVKLVSQGAEKKTVAAAELDASGIANLEGVAAGQKVTAVLSTRGVQVASPPFEIPAKGGLMIKFAVSWRDAPASLGASFRGLAPGKTYFARALADGRIYLSQPFQMVPDRGAVAGVLVFPRLLVGFQGGGELDDDKMWFQLKFSIANPSLVPLDAGEEGILLPLPPGFIGASVEDKMAARIKVEDHGFVWRGSFPPGQRDFMASFAVPVVDGVMSFDMPLPYGAWDSHLVVEDFPGSDLNVPSSANRQARTTPDGRRFVLLSKINIRPGQSLKFSMTGLPQAASWKSWARNLAGLAVVALLLWGFGSMFASFGARAAVAGAGTGELEKRREALLARVVALDQKRAKGKLGREEHERERGRLIAQLETIYEQLERR